MSPELSQQARRDRNGSPTCKNKVHNFLRRKQSGLCNATPNDPIPNDQQSRENKSSVYMTAAYNALLAIKGSHNGPNIFENHRYKQDSLQIFACYRTNSAQDTLFRDDLFDETCNCVEDRNEDLVIRHISPLICPSPLDLRIYGVKNLGCLTESFNQGWNSVIPVVYSRPQPDYSVGFGRSSFTDAQLEKLKPFAREIASHLTSYFMGTWRMYFPFLTCEVKCGAAALDVTDRQNVHSMIIAVRAVVELFKYIKRKKELDREILAFSISHDHRLVRIYGHYPVIEGDKTTFYRHLIKDFSLISEDGKDK